MARPERHNADYFPFYAKDGKTLFVLESKYGCKGTGFFTNVMRFLTLENDHHFCIADENDKLYFFARCHCDVESGMDMLDLMAKCRKIDGSLWVSAGVIVSYDLLESLKDAYRRRANEIITIAEIAKKYVIDNIKPIIDDINPLNSGNKPQRKGKERKLKERIVFTPPLIDDVINFFIEKGYSPEIAKKAFEYYDTANWKDSKGNQVRNWKQKMIAVWLKDENKVGNNQTRSIQPTTYAQAQDAERREIARRVLEATHHGEEIDCFD